MDAKSIYRALQAEFGEEHIFDLHEPAQAGHDAWFCVRPDVVPGVAEHLRTDPSLAFDYLECLTGVDYPDKDEIQLVYHTYSYAHRHRAIFKAAVPRSDPRIRTVSDVWSAANWQERECYDLFGVVFVGHPSLRRILLPDDWVGHPMRRDYKEAPDYHGIPTTRESPLELLTIKTPGKGTESDKGEKKAAAKAEPAPKKPAAKTTDEPAPSTDAKDTPGGEQQT